MVAVASIPITPADVAAAYRERGDLSPVALGDMMLACRRELGISQQELARRTGITPGVLHQHESVALLPEPYRGYADTGKLTMKEARSLADLGWGRERYYRPDPRLPEIAALFTSGRLSSLYAEPVVAAAKANPNADVDELVTLAFKRAKKQPRDWDGPPVVIRRSLVDTKALQAHILALAGEIEAWGMGEHSEVERLPVLAAARVLDDRLHRLALGATTANGHAEASKGVGNRRLALLLEEPRKVLAGQEGLAI